MQKQALWRAYALHNVFSDNKIFYKLLFLILGYGGVDKIGNCPHRKKVRYTSDLTDVQWKIIKDYFPAGNKSKYEKREMMNAVLYLVKTGCQWRNLPKDFPNWKAVPMFYYCFTIVHRKKESGTRY